MSAWLVMPIHQTIKGSLPPPSNGVVYKYSMPHAKPHEALQSDSRNAISRGGLSDVSAQLSDQVLRQVDLVTRNSIDIESAGIAACENSPASSSHALPVGSTNAEGASTGFSAMYSGTVWHKRFLPKTHAFSYRLSLMLFDLDRLEHTLNTSVLIGREWWRPIRFKRDDFHVAGGANLREAVAESVRLRCKQTVRGKILMLASPRVLGVSMNPLVTYYCLDKDNKDIEFIVVEVHNTPWNERHIYVLDLKYDNHTPGTADRKPSIFMALFDKRFTVSPFHTLDMIYAWQSSAPGDNLLINIQNFQPIYKDDRLPEKQSHPSMQVSACEMKAKKVFSAEMKLARTNFTSRALLAYLLRYPVAPLRILVAIYWQALLLFLKGLQFYGKDKAGTSLRDYTLTQGANAAKSVNASSSAPVPCDNGTAKANANEKPL